MNFEIKHIDDITIFKLNELKLDANISGLVKAEFTLLVKADDALKLIVDLTGVESCDSTGLSTLLVANRLIGQNDGILKIVAPSEKILQLIKITQLHRVMSLCDTVDAAIKEISEE